MEKPLIKVEQSAIRYLTVQQFCDMYQAFKPGGIRALIFNEHKNGLAESGAIVRVGRKVLMNPLKFFNWIEQQQNQGGTK